MALEGAGYISDIVPTNPDGADQKNEGDDHIRNFKKSVQDSFANVSGPVTATHTQLNYVTEIGDSSDVAKGDALIVGKRTDVGASEFTLHKYNENRPYNVVTDFGADNTGASDCSTEVQAAFTAAFAAGRAAIYFPPGLYKLDSQVAITSATAEDILICGDGVDVAEIIVPSTNTTGAISIDHTGATADAKKSVTTIRDLSIVADGAGCGTALEVKNLKGGNLHRRNLYVSRVDIRGSDIETDYFLQGIIATGVWHPTFKDVNVGGPFGPNVDKIGSSPYPNSFLDSAVRYKMTIGIDVTDSYHPEFDNCYVWSAATGISSVNLVDNPGREGFRIRNTNIVNVRTAIHYGRAGREPTFWLHNCHINVRDVGVDIDGCSFIKIDGLVSFNEDANDTWTSTPADIRLKNTQYTDIENCVFHQTGPSDRINIQFVASTFGDSIRIRNNLFNSAAASGTGIWLGSSATNMMIAFNEFAASYGTKINDTTGVGVAATILYRTSDNDEGITLESQEDDNLKGPNIRLYRNSASPADNDVLGQLTFVGNNSVPETVDYAAIRAQVEDWTDGTEDGSLEFFTMLAGSQTTALALTPFIAADETNMFLLRHNGTTINLKRVELAPISGGYQVLRVAST